MKNVFLSKAMALLLGMAVSGLVFAPPVQAQFLNKLSKGLDKVNKKLDRVNDALSGDKKSPNKDNNKPTTPQGNANATANKGTATINESGWKTIETSGRTPFLSSKVRFLEADPHNVTDVHENVFAVRRGTTYEFWKMDGTKLFDAKWMVSKLAQEPAFSGGVVPMKSVETNAAGKQCICLLYLDGRVKELDPSFNEATNFKDGLAIAHQMVNYQNKCFYINARGEKVFAHLTEMGLDDEIRPLRDGLRAFKAHSTWGFIDAQGKVVLTNKYREVRDFSEGYAWVREERENYNQPEKNWTLIDKQGNVVFTAPINAKIYSDVNSGRFCLIKAPDLRYYDLKGNQLGAFDNGTSIYEGYAFVKFHQQGLWDISLKVVDKDCRVVGSIGEKNLTAGGIHDGYCHFSEYGLATLGDIVFNPRGEIVLDSYNNHHGVTVGGFGDFTACGLARVEYIQLGSRYFSGIMNVAGEILWLFGNQQIRSGEWRDIPKLPWPVPEPQPGDTLVIINPDTIALGPTQREEVKYSVRVKASPGEGGMVNLSGSSPVRYGEYVTVTASPNKDWAITHITTDLEGAMPPKLGEPYAVLGDATYTVHFLKKDDETAPTNTGCYQGSFNDLTGEFKFDVDMYAEISAQKDIATPYGEKTYGFLTVMFDPNCRYVSNQGDVVTNILFLPMNIVGYQKDAASGKRWLVAEGGSMTFGNLKTSPKGNALAGLFFNTIMAINGESSPQFMPRRYRIEMLNVNEQTGEFTCGMMQTFSPKAGGWVDGNDPSLRQTTKGFMMTKNDKGLPSDLFNGIQLRAAKKRTDVNWYPPASWYNNKSDVLEGIIATMKSQYGNFKSDYDDLFEGK